MKSFLDNLYTFVTAVAIFTVLFCGVEAFTEKAAGEPSPLVVESVAYPVVYCRELKNLGNGNYLCVVWSYPSRDTTIIKLTASEKAKLQRGYLK